MNTGQIELLFEKHACDGWSGDTACLGVEEFKAALRDLIPTPAKFIDIVFDGPPGPEAGRFVEVEDETGKSISVGEWLVQLNGFHALRIHMPSDNSDVAAFQAKFDVPMAPKPAFLDAAAGTFRIDFMMEELSEFVEAVETRDLEKAADALVDLVYVAHGTALMMGLPWTQLWDEVQRANMAKERAANAGQSKRKRKSSLDVIKPPGWTPPDHSVALRQAQLNEFGAHATFNTTTKEFEK